MPTSRHVAVLTAMFQTVPSLGLLENQLLDVCEYPVINQGKARCDIGIIADLAPDPHDWQLWKTGRLVIPVSGVVEQWPVYLRRCSKCGSVEVRREGWRQTIDSMKPRRVKPRTPGPADELLGWYEGD